MLILRWWLFLFPTCRSWPRLWGGPAHRRHRTGRGSPLRTGGSLERFWLWIHLGNILFYIYNRHSWNAPNQTQIYFSSLCIIFYIPSLSLRRYAPLLSISQVTRHHQQPSIHTWFSYQHVRLSTNRWDDSTFILFYKTYPVLQKYTKSFLPSMDWYSKLCIELNMLQLCGEPMVGGV